VHLDDTNQVDAVSKDEQSISDCQLPKTITECLKALEQDKDNMRVLFRLAQLYMSEEHLSFDKALARFEELEGLVKTRPQEIPTFELWLKMSECLYRLD